MKITKQAISAALIVTAVNLIGMPLAIGGTSPALPAGSFQVADARDVVRDENTNTTVHSSDGECVRTKWSNNQDPCAAQIAVIPPPRQEIKKTVALSRDERTVYMGFNQTSLSPQMQEKLANLAQVVQSSDNVKGARIVGYADRIGDPSYNEKLSQQRAENVRQFLISKGLINTSIADTRWVGASDPTTNCSNKLPHAQLVDCLAKDRRVEVEIDYATNVQASNTVTQ